MTRKTHGMPGGPSGLDDPESIRRFRRAMGLDGLADDLVHIDATGKPEHRDTSANVKDCGEDTEAKPAYQYAEAHHQAPSEPTSAVKTPRNTSTTAPPEYTDTDAPFPAKVVDNSSVPSSSEAEHSNYKKAYQAGLNPSFLDRWGSRAPTSRLNPSTPSEDLSNQLVFKAWPTSHSRSRPTAQIRTCHLKNLPASATATFVCGLVFGGSLERVTVHRNDADDANPTTASATVRFLSGAACQLFCDCTANGLPLRAAPRNNDDDDDYAFVTPGRDVDVIGGLLARQIASGVTRCVRAAPVDAALTAAQLRQLAAEQGRRVEAVEDDDEDDEEDDDVGTTQRGPRVVVWRFCDVAAAVAFRGVLAQREDFERVNVSFADDPCALRQVRDYA